MTVARPTTGDHPAFVDDDAPDEGFVVAVEALVRTVEPVVYDAPDEDDTPWYVYARSGGLPASVPDILDVPFLPSGWTALGVITLHDGPYPPFAVMPLPMTAARGYQPVPTPEAEAIPGAPLAPNTLPTQATKAQPVADGTAYANSEPEPMP